MNKSTDPIEPSLYEAAAGDVQTFAAAVNDPEKRRALQRLAFHYRWLAAGDASGGGSTTA